MNHHILRLLAIPLIAFGASAAFAARPNVIIVMTDDQGYPELSAHGNPILKTPISATESKWPTRASAPMCSFARLWPG